MNESCFLDMAGRLLPLPTAPFHEQLVAAEVRRFAAQRPGLTCQADVYGNLSLCLGSAPPHLVLTAHMDHPGLGFGAGDDGDWVFQRLGGVPDDLTGDAAVVVYGPDDGRPVARGRVVALLADGTDGSAGGRPAFRVRVDGPAPPTPPPGAFAMWDLPAFAVDGRRLIGRACDDLAGVAVTLAVLDGLHRERRQGVGALLTRAEETGFGGMLAAAEAGALHRDAVHVNIECSSCRAGAPLGAGPVLRVGDRRWIFDAGVTGALAQAAAACASSRPGFRFQRRLMDGGTCEATALSRSGIATGAVALPLDNYHNHGGDRLRPEAVHLDDAEGLVELLLQLARSGDARDAVATSLKGLDGMLEERRQGQTPELLRTAGVPPAPDKESTR